MVLICFCVQLCILNPAVVGQWILDEHQVFIVVYLGSVYEWSCIMSVYLTALLELCNDGFSGTLSIVLKLISLISKAYVPLCG